MCGLVGYIGNIPAVPILLEGLRRLEYRGYDSAGICVVTPEHRLVLEKTPGKLDCLVEKLDGRAPEGTLGIGHTRWATHGRPTEANAHPHLDCHHTLSVAHNGIIENYVALRDELRKKGHHFHSETDSEVLVHLIEECYQGDLQQALRWAISRIEGACALVVIDRREPDLLLGVRINAPLVVGVGKDGFFLASDIPAILKYTKKVIILEEGEIAALTPSGVTLTSLDGQPISRAPARIQWSPQAAEKGGFPHFVLKEIFEEPYAIQNTLRGRLSKDDQIELPEIKNLTRKLPHVKRVYVVACGTSSYAGLVGKYLVEEWAQVPVEVIFASEFRYGQPILDKSTLVIAITQSGETADTLAAFRLAKEKGCPTLLYRHCFGQITRLVDIAASPLRHIISKKL